MNKKEYYDLKYVQSLARERERKERQAYNDLHKQHKLNISSKNYIENIKKVNKIKSRFYVGSLFRLFLIIFIAILLCRVFFKVNSSSNNLNFTSFLDFLSNLNSVEVDLSFPDFSIVNDWGVFNFLRNFFNVFSSILSFVVWLGKNIVNLFNYIIAIVNFLFV